MDQPRPGASQTLLDVLRHHVEQRGEQTVYTFLADGETEQGHLTFAQVDRRARAIAAHLQAQGLAGERALMLFNPGLDFITAFLGCLYAGTVAVPAYPPASKRHWPRLRSIVEDARPQWVLTASAELSKIRRVSDQIDAFADIQWLTTDTIDDSRGDGWTPPALDGDSLAFLQYTSGSTSTPKGVMISHGNLMHNQEVIHRGFGLDADAVIVGWLPLYHDMGLIGNLLHPLYLGSRLVFMAPVAFLQQPIRWLRAISRYRGTTSGGPNFAYDLCCQRITDEQLRDLDLASWSVAFSGAEPVRAATLDRFAERFAACGFQRRAFFPCYGMAETTLMTTGGDPAEPPVVRRFDARSLEQDEAVEITDSDVSDGGDGADREARRLVGCGPIGWQLDVVIVDPGGPRRLDDGHVGEVWVAGGSVARGYWQRAEASRESFAARLPDAPEAGPYLRTGDLGFVDRGQLFVTGRSKDLIILRGRNHYPQDIELTVEGCHGDLRPGSGAAVAVTVDDEERLVIIHEVERRPKDSPEVIAEAVRRAVTEAHEVQVYEVVLIRVATVPKTSSGKIQRHACRQQYLDGTLTVVGQLRQERVDEIGSEILLSPSILEATDGEERGPLLQAFLVDRVARLAKVPRSSIDVEAPLTGIGLDSLTSVQLKNDIEERLGLEVPLDRLLDDANLRQLTEYLLAARAGGDPVTSFAIASPPVRQHPLSHGQKALWYLQRLDPQSSAYHISGAARLEASLDAPCLERAARLLVRRHSALRTTYAVIDGEPRAHVAEDGGVDFLALDLRGLAEDTLRQRLTDEAERPFDLEQGPVLRVVMATGDSHCYLLLALHHIASDFATLALLLQELAQGYFQMADGAADEAVSGLEPLEAHFADFAQHEAQRLQGDEGEALWDYWKQELAGELPILDLPTDRPRPGLQSFHGALAHGRLDAETSRRLRHLARQQGVTLYMLLLSLYEVLLHRFTGQNDILVGSPFTQRSQPALAPLAGYLVNPLVLRGDLSNDPTFEELLAQTRGKVLQAFVHRDFPFPLLVERLPLPHDASRSPVFQTFFTLQKDRLGEEGIASFSLGQSGAQLAFGPTTLESVALTRRSARFDLALQVADTDGELRTSLEYNADLFDPGTADRLLTALASLAKGVCGTDDDQELADGIKPHQKRLSQLPILDAAERQQLLDDWRVPELDDGEDGARLCLHHLILRQARKTPDAIALSWYPPDETPHHWTYGEVDRRTGQVADRLRQAGVGPGSRVAICGQRRPELVIGLLAILRCGAAYVPLDPAYPGSRLEFILEDSQASVLLLHDTLPDSLAGTTLPRLDLAEILADEVSPEPSPGDPEADGLHPDLLAYVIYTSGSTGRPKGVAIGHRAVVTLMRWSRLEFSAAQLERVLFSTSICFDLSVWEMYLPLSVGGRAVVVDHALETPKLPQEAAITLVNTVPSAMDQLAGLLPPSVKTVNLCGELLVRSLVDRIYAQPTVEEVYNFYGPSEDTVYSTWVVVPPNEPEEPTIGRALANTYEYVVDRHGMLTPRGVVGELLLGGDELAHGYHGRPALTAEKFIPDPHPKRPGARVYRTGDLARHFANGELEFIGRVDHQVKIRGFRIELGEIEHALEEHRQISRAVVMAKKVRDELLLVAYLAVGEAVVGSDDLRTFLGEKLPAYMVPQAFVPLAEFPLTPNGKIDRKALPEPQLEAADDAFVAPSTAVEEILAEIWQDILEVERVGIHDNFFDLGGHSLLATRVLSRVTESFGVELPIRALLEVPTIHGLSEAIAEELMADVDEETLAALMAEMEPAGEP